MAASHRFILSGGHRNTDRGGASGERAWTYGSLLAMKAEIEKRGGEAVIVHNLDNDSDPTDSTNWGLQRVAQQCVALEKKYGPFDAYISSHYNGTGSNGSSGFHAIIPDAWSGVDVRANNPLDVKLAKAMAKRVGETKTVSLLSWTSDAKAGSPGVMSERETNVGSQGYRLGEMYGTIGFRERTARVIIEAANISNPQEAAYIRDSRWVKQTYVPAIVTALEDVFGVFSDHETPAPDPTPVEPEYSEPNVIPQLEALKDHPVDQLPVYVQVGEGDKAVYYFPLNRTLEVKAGVTTPRNLYADRTHPGRTGADLPSGEKFFGKWGAVNADGEPFAVTLWYTRVWLVDCIVAAGA